MIVKQIVDEDFVNYKKPSMFIAFPNCDWKCEKECGERVCQNGTLATSPDIELDERYIVDRYMSNPITSAIVIGGLEPFYDYRDLMNLIWEFRVAGCEDDIVIYTGYTAIECYRDFLLHTLARKELGSIIIKFGRYVPNQKPHYDEILGVNLASDNQHAEIVNFNLLNKLQDEVHKEGKLRKLERHNAL